MTDTEEDAEIVAHELIAYRAFCCRCGTEGDNLEITPEFAIESFQHECRMEATHD